MSTVIEDLKRLEERILARIQELESRVAQLEEFREVVGVGPGIIVRELVAQLGVNRTSLYPVVRQLVIDGLLYKDGRGLWPASR